MNIKFVEMNRCVAIRCNESEINRDMLKDIWVDG